MEENNNSVFIDTRPHDTSTTATEKLDALLLWLEKNKGKQFSFYEYEMPTAFSAPKRIIITERERGKIIEKLSIDKYVSIDMRGEAGKHGDIAHYGINFEGEVFIQNGGYSKKKENSDWELLKIKLNFWVLLFAAIAATTYYGLEILKFMCTHF